MGNKNDNSLSLSRMGVIQLWRGDLMRKYRAEKGIMQKEVAEILEVTEAAVSRWETNTMKPSPVSARKIAELLGVEVEELYLEEFTPDQLKRMKAIPILNTNDETFVPLSLDVTAAFVTNHDYIPWYREGDILYIDKGDAKDGDLVIVRDKKGNAVAGSLNLQSSKVINPQGLHSFVELIGKVSYMLERVGR